MKAKRCASIGIKCEIVELPETIDTFDVIEKISLFNKDPLSPRSYGSVTITRNNTKRHS